MVSSKWCTRSNKFNKKVMVSTSLFISIDMYVHYCKVAFSAQLFGVETSSLRAYAVNV